MMQSPENLAALEKFIDKWDDDEQGTKAAFLRLKSYLEDKNDVEFDFNSRPGVTHSLRAAHPNGKRPLFVLIDVVEDTPRWLSVCFYGDSVTDPGEVGNLIPDSLLDEDGYCFDVETGDDMELAYIEKRLDEAYNDAAA